MPEPMPQPGAAPLQPQDPNQNPASEAPKPDERYERLEQTIFTLKKQIDGLSAAQRAALKAKEDSAPEQNVTLKSMKAELDARDAKLKQKAINGQIDAFLRDSGVPETQRPFIKSYIRDQYGDKLNVNEQDEVVYSDEFDTKPFHELGQKILALSGAQAFQPPVQTPGQVGSRSPFSGLGRQGPMVPDINNMSVQDMVKNPAAADAAIKAKAALLLRGGTTRT